MHNDSTTCPFRYTEVGSGPLANPEGELRCMVGCATSKRSFRKGSPLFLQGEPSSYLYSLTKGVVKICRSYADGHEQIIGLAQPSNLLVGLQSICESRYAYSAYAATPVETCRINQEQLLEMVRERGDVAMGLVSALNAQLSYSRKLIESIAIRRAGAKIASLILMMVPPQHDEEINLRLPLTRREIADLLGLSEETVCRHMAKLQRQRIIHTPRGYVAVLDEDALLEAADASAGE